ncbi:hypothetical protein B0J11DRAFT_445816 [Dendryphion nanum]|uniref:Zn(2)-C6 fungal-type domain-containing protein n=1 Tax=Dendryphion nanum TaxID=256645 RepID=A0A9P9D533_9PLEO|nr:hypothetical protein B0J11DRAFT_445816 [Dendryphion nanum]
MPDDSPLSQLTPATHQRDFSTPRDSPPRSPDTSLTDGTPRDIDDGGGRDSEKRGKGKLITRKSHRKSRLGCGNCKQRRIKCDEKRPHCTNCQKRDIHCDYIPSSLEPPPIPTTHFTKPPIQSSSSFSSSTINISDVRLMHHWTTSTCHTLSSWYSGATAHQITNTELALSHPSPHLLHLTFAFTAFHLAHCRPTERTSYIALADHHYGLALPLVTSELASMTPSNSDAVYFSVQLICLLGFARGPRPGEYLAFGSPGRSEWLFMFRGIRTTIESLENGNFEGTKLRSTRTKHRPLTGLSAPPEWETRLQDLKGHITFISPASDRDDNLHSLTILEEMYRNRYEEVDSEYHVVFGWLYRQSEGFLERLQAMEQIQLILYAHFVVLISDVERFWYMKGWTWHIMNGIWEALREENRAWIRWPMNVVGWIPP